MFNTLKYYKFWFTISGLILLFGIISMSLYGLKLGIDFKGGSLLQIQFDRPFDLSKVQQVVSKANIGNFQIQTANENELILKTKNLSPDEHNTIESSLTKEIGGFKELQFNSIGPTIGSQLKRDAIYQLLLVSFGIVLYLGYAFRKVAKPVTSWRFGWSAVIALFHDLLFVLGVFSLLGHFKGVEIDSLFVTAMLTVLGFSVHDTIVVFDRIRENLKIYAGESLEFIINHSISQTIVRSLNTSLTVLFVLLALLLFGGESIKYFVFALFIGVLVGTYSSIFIATPALYLWQSWKTKKD